MQKDIDCVVCGSCVVDVLVRPFDLSQPVGAGKLLRSEPLKATTGGIVSNAGITMARLGMKLAALTYVGADPWADIIRSRYAAEGIDVSRLVAREDAATSTSAVLIDGHGERSFVHAVGAPRLLDAAFFRENLDVFARSRAMLLGYYPLLPNLLDDLPEVLAAIQACGCQTALDAAGEGGALEPLAGILPHLDVYVPSYAEAQHQTGEADPRKMIEAYRRAGGGGLLGVKLGSRGALISPRPGELNEIAPVTPPGAVVDTTGAGDCFMGGLICGLLRGMDPADAARLGAAAGACCVTEVGATRGIRGFEETVMLLAAESRY